jgi:hypothetical protein
MQRPELKPGYPALQGPAAPHTREIRLDFDSGEEETNRTKFTWAKGVVVVGFHASLWIYGEEEVADPTLDTILVSLDRNDDFRFTTRQRDPDTAAEGHQFVTLSAITEQEGRRLHNIVIPNSRPELGVQFRWEGGADKFKTCRVKLAAFWEYLSPDPSENK